MRRGRERIWEARNQLVRAARVTGSGSLIALAVAAREFRAAADDCAETHALVDDEEWSMMERVPGGPGTVGGELRNCPCGSTISRGLKFECDCDRCRRRVASAQGE